MMETTEQGSRDDRALGQRWRSGDRLLLREDLMRTRLVLEAQKLRDESWELRFAEDEDMTEQLATVCAHEPLGEGVHVRGSGRGPADARPDRLEDAREAPPELPIPIAEEYQRMAIQRGVASLLRAPLVGGRIGRGGVDDHAPAQVEEEEDEDLAEADVVGLDEVGDPRDVVLQERRPTLRIARPTSLRSATMSCWRSIAFSATSRARGRTTSESNATADRTRSSILSWYRGRGAATRTKYPKIGRGRIGSAGGVALARSHRRPAARRRAQSVMQATTASRSPKT